ncbi:probable ATP synthase subunit d, mitochondrial [Coccomyxa sp. Obi]|nr:probable ATP synthase subunit d, mitochondrial [Coccomyxa sp. Obi]
MLRSALSRNVQKARSGLMLMVQQRHMAAASELAVQEPDWDTFYSLVTSDEAKREVGSLRTQFNELRQKLIKPSTAPKEIKWDEFKDVDPALLDNFKKAFAGVKIPKYDVTEELKKVDAEFEPLLKSSEELEAFSKQRHAEIEKEIATIDEETEKLSKRTVDDELASDPALLKEVDEEISKGSYY